MHEPEPEYLDTAGVAEHIGVRKKSIIDYVRRRLIPQPDLVLFGQNLWLVTTIDEWRALRYVPYHKRPVLMRTTTRRPRGLPKPAKRAGETVPRGKDDKRARRVSSSVGASKKPAVSTVTEAVAKEVAGLLRAEGHYCTSVDVMTLADVEDEETLEHERRVLRQRILRKLRRKP